MGRNVIGQTGSSVLSNDAVNRAIGKNRTVRYRYEKCANGYRAVVVGPFHSRMYGVCGFGAKRWSAIKSLWLRLGNDYGYLGNLIRSDVDEADTVGIVDQRLFDQYAMAKPITIADVCV